VAESGSPDRREEEPAPRPAQLSLDALVAPWWVAVDAAQAALRAAGAYLDPGELSEHSALLARQRQAVARVLHELARDQHSASALLDWLDVQRITPAMLGLPTQISACVFDLEGVLTTGAAAHIVAWTHTFDPFLLERAARGHQEFVPFDQRREYQDYVAGWPRLAGVRSFLTSRGIRLPEGSPDDAPTAETVHGLANRKNLMLRDALERGSVAAFAGSRSYLEAARMLGLRLAVVSASANTQSILERAGLAHLIEESIDATAIETEGLQPQRAPDRLVAACQRLDVRLDETAAFETTPLGIAAARAAGARLIVAVDRDGQAKALRHCDPDVVIGDLTELLAHTGTTALHP
jgi:beta-phosphoglucomutase-like phosphatase (HAD superfamily)